MLDNSGHHHPEEKTEEKVCWPMSPSHLWVARPVVHQAEREGGKLNQACVCCAGRILVGNKYVHNKHTWEQLWKIDSFIRRAKGIFMPLGRLPVSLGQGLCGCAPLTGVGRCFIYILRG